MDHAASRANAFRANNFDAIRLIAAVSVVFSHAFLVAEGTQQNEPFVRLTGNQCILGLIGVFVFFVISGFLVTQSYVATASAPRFVLKRGLRILPALLVNVLVCGLVIGPMVSSLPLGDYLRDPGLPRFFGRSLALALGENPLPGVAFSDNGVGAVVNGSLWSLRYEIMMYGMVLLLGALGLLRLATSLLLLALGIIGIYFETELQPWGDLGGWLWMLSFFAAGMVLYFLRGSRLFRWETAVIAALGLAAITLSHHLILLFSVFGGFLTIYLALRHSRALDGLSRFGDLSYGVYIYGWPVEECVVYAKGGAASWIEVLLWSLPISLGLALLSWHGIEKAALRLAHRPARRRSAPLAAVAR